MPTTFSSFDPLKFDHDPEEEFRRRITNFGIGFGALLGLALFINVATHLPRHPIAPPGPPKAAAISSFNVLRSPTQIYRIDTPSGWLYKNAADPSGMFCAEAFYTKGGAIIIIDDGSASTQDKMTSTQVGTMASNNPALGPVMSAGDGQQSADPDSQPTESGGSTLDYQHQQGQIFSQLLGRSTEGEPASLTTNLGPADISQFVALPDKKIRFPYKIRGYRETILTDTRRVTVMCLCPDANWSTLQPGFWHIVNSVSNYTNN